MADGGHPVASTRISHRQSSSQSEFTKRLRHLQRSDPVEPNELSRRLNIAIAEARNGDTSRRRRLANAPRSHTRTPSEDDTPRQIDAGNPLGIARSSLASQAPAEDEDDPLSRVARALRACRDADPQKPYQSPPRQKPENKSWRETAVDAHDEFAEVTKAVARRSRAFSAPKVVEIERPKEPVPQPPTVLPMQNTTNIMEKKRVPRKAPPPLILTVMPKAIRPEIVDVSSPITTKPPNALPDLQPLSPFGANFSENGGSFLVYQPSEIRHSAISVSATSGASTSLQSPASPIKSLSSPMAATAVRLDYGTYRDNSVSGASHSMPVNHSAYDETDDYAQQYPHMSPYSEEADDPMDDIAPPRRRKSIPSIVLSEKSGTDGTDAHSDRGTSPIFEASAAQSSRTSLGQHQVPPQNELKRQPSKRIGFTPEQFADMGAETTLSQRFPPSPLPETEPPSPVSPLERTMTYETTANEDHEISPLPSPTLCNLPKRISSLPSPLPGNNSNRYSIPRKPVGSGCFDHYVHDLNAAQPPTTSRPPRHDSTGFTVAREFIRESVDSEHVRHVHSAAHTNEPLPNPQAAVSVPPPLPKLVTTGQQSSQYEMIADGIALIDSAADSPTIGRLIQKLPLPAKPQFREPSYTKEVLVSPNGSRQNSTSIESPNSQQFSPSSQEPVRDSSTTFGTIDSATADMKQMASRSRRGTDATITSLSSRPDYRARPLIQDAPEMPAIPLALTRPRTAVAKQSQPAAVAPLPTKMPTKIKFPPRANHSEVAAMSPESLKLLHEQEALLRKRYDAVLNPIDDALKKRPAEQVTEAPAQESTRPSHRHSKSVDIQFAVKSNPTFNADTGFVQQQVQLAREQAAIRAQRRNLGAAARNGSIESDGFYEYTPMDRYSAVSGEAMALPMGFAGPEVHTKSAFTFDDDTQEKRRQGKWKFWKAK